MGLSDFYALAREVDPGWLALTVEGGYLWSLVAWRAWLKSPRNLRLVEQAAGRA